MRDVLCVGSFYYGSGDVVHEIINGFRAIESIRVVHHDPKIYFNALGTKNISHSDLFTVSSAVIDFFLSLPAPKAIVLIAGGITLSDSDYTRVHERGILIVSMQLSDPDDFERRGSKIAQWADIVTTNSPDSIEAYSQYCDIRFMMWGRSQIFDSYVEHSESEKNHNLIVLGGYRPERLALLKLLVKEGLTIKVVGSGWEKNIRKKLTGSIGSRKRVSFTDHQVGLQKIKSIIAAEAYLSFSETMAGHNNLKYGVYESFAARTPVISDWVGDSFKNQLSIEKFNFENLFINNLNKNFSDHILESFEKILNRERSNVADLDSDWSLSWKSRLVKTLPEIFK